jgi:short-subunit dehydrogenase
VSGFARFFPNYEGIRTTVSECAPQDNVGEEDGRVLFIASEAAISLSPEMAHYGATKTMQLSLSRSLAELTKGTAVTVNTVMPDSTKTEAFGHRTGTNRN